MVRKIGFGNKEKSVADAYLDRFRARSRDDQRALEKTTARKVKRKWPVIVFLSVWLVFWSVGMGFVTVAILGGDGNGFLLIWITFAAFGWLAVVKTLIKQIRGEPQND